MAIIKKNDLKQMDEKTLDERLKDLKLELVRINAQISMGTMPEKPGRIKEIRKTIARIITKKNNGRLRNQVWVT